MSTRAHTARAVFPPVAAGPALAGCGGDDEGGSTPGSPTSTATVTETVTATETGAGGSVTFRAS